MSKPQPVAVETPKENEGNYEQNHVHDVYEVIATHFSDTRYKPWPVVEDFYLDYQLGALVPTLAVEMGNISVSIQTSSSLDLIEVPIYIYYFTISIAVIHHFSTPERRISAIKELLRIVKPGGKVLVFVWALEQTKFTKRNFQPGEQDVFVPWVLAKKKDEQDDGSANKVYNRYYHLFRKGELDDLFGQIDDVAIDVSGYDRDNHYVIATKL
ncbi:unnamed protein product [Absidia cylindrospora]